MTRSRLKHFLIVFDHNDGRIIEERPFDDGNEAVAAYEASEQKYEGREGIETVLISSDSLETVRVTHANYYQDDTSSKYLPRMPRPASASPHIGRPGSRRVSGVSR